MKKQRPAQSASGYRGVQQDRRSGSWSAHIKVNGKKRHLGTYDTAEQAAAVYNAAAREYFGDQAALNEVPEDRLPPPKRRTTSQVMQRQPGRGARGYRGVFEDTASGRFRAMITVRGEHHYLGMYRTPEEAAGAYNTAALAHFGPDAALNDVPTLKELPQLSRSSSEAGHRKPIRSASGYRGVVEQKATGKAYARIARGGVSHHLGTHETVEQAAAVYNQAALATYEQGAALNPVPLSVGRPYQKRMRALGIQRRPVMSACGYKGVSWNARGRRWQARIGKDGVRYFLGAYETPEQAATAYNWAALDLYGDCAWLNPVPMDGQVPGEVAFLFPYRGVVLHPISGTWTAFLVVGDRTRQLGSYDTAEEAAVAYNRAAREAFGELAVRNSLQEAREHGPSVEAWNAAAMQDCASDEEAAASSARGHEASRLPTLARQSRPARSRSGYRGVSKQGNDSWRAQIQVQGVTHATSDVRHPRAGGSSLQRCSGALRRLERCQKRCADR